MTQLSHCFRRFSCWSILCYALTSPFAHSASDDVDDNLPVLGDTASAQFSLEQEHQLGRLWLKALRSRTPMLSDPLINDYLKYLTYQLVETSQLKDRRLELIVVDSPALNAFAVPGGVVGVNGGLFLYAQTEQQFSSVMAHELAHLSQRHFSRGVEARRRDSIPNLAALLASIAIAATVGGEAGTAAIAASQGLALDKQLRFSRQNEQEADRIGLKNLAQAGMDPRAMAEMFGIMVAAQRLQGGRPPEFLLTHPLTESRVSDARSRAKDYPRVQYQENLDYYLVRNRIRLHYTDTPAKAIALFQAELSDAEGSTAKDIARYGLALAYLKAGRIKEALTEIQPLISKEPMRIGYLIAYTDIMLDAGQSHAVAKQLAKALSLNPNNYPLSIYYAKVMEHQQRFKEATSVLTELGNTRPNDPYVWYQLAEVSGLAGNIVTVHQARAEYFILTGNMDAALEQLKYAQARTPNNYEKSAEISQRVEDVRNYQEQLKRF